MLELRKLRKSYGAMTVIPGIDLRVREGELVGVIGPNGAGKTTLFGLVAGGVSCDAGTVWLGGRDITRLSADQRCRTGIARTFQVPRPFGGISVFENALAAATFGGGKKGAAAERAAAEAVSMCGLEAVADTRAQDLQLLQRKRLELTRAIATGPRLLLLDEVAGGLTELEVHALMALVKAIHASGVTVLWIEHLVNALVGVAQRLVVLAAGEVLADGVPREVIASPLVQHTYMGAPLEAKAHGAGRADVEILDALH